MSALLQFVQKVTEFNARTDVVEIDYLSSTDDLERQTPEVKAAIEEIQQLADGVLITSKGQADYVAIGVLKREHNISVTKGESDSFGWLTGVVHTDHGMIVYG